MEEEIIKSFIPITEESDITLGKYAAKKSSFFEDINKWQNKRKMKKYDIRPIQFTFEITNKCNCNCKDCGMAANRIKTKRTTIEEDELKKIVDELDYNGIPSLAITGGEPFLAFDKMCSMINYACGKIDIVKIISNGFWGKNAKYYFEKLEESGLFKNMFFIPTIQVSIGEQTVPYEDISNIINYVATHYSKDQLHFGIIHTREKGLKESKLLKLYRTYEKKYGEFPKNIIYLTDAYYVNSNPIAKDKLDVPVDSVYNELAFCTHNFKQEIGAFVSPKVFMKCNGDCYPCEIFNLFEEVYLGNLFKDGLNNILKNYNENKYIKFIKDYGNKGFRNVIPKKILDFTECETPCTACEFCIKFCEKNRLIR